MHKVKLTIATTDYDHFRDFRTGAVEAQGIDHTWLTLGHHEIFTRFTFNREWDVTELSFAKFTAQVTRDDPDIIGLPVFASRLFRFGSFYVNRRNGIKPPPSTCAAGFTTRLASALPTCIGTRPAPTRPAASRRWNSTCRPA